MNETGSETLRPRQSLWQLGAGQSSCIVGFDESLAKNYRIRLMELGFHPGEWVSCLQAPRLGAPHVYRVSNSVFSLDDDIARHIYVEAKSRDA